MTKERINALQQIVNLSKDYKITATEITQALEEHETNQYSKILLYIGCILIATTFFILLYFSLPNIPNLLKNLLIMGAGVIFYCLMIRFSNHEDSAFIWQPLFIIAPILIASGALLSAAMFLPNVEQSYIILILCSFMLIQQLSTFLYFRTTTPLFFIILFASIAYLSLTTLSDINLHVVLFILGISYILISIYLNYTKYNSIIFLGLLCGTIATNLSYLSIAHETSAQYAILIIMTAQMWCGLTIKNKTLTFVNFIGIIFYLHYLTIAIFQSSIGWLLTTSILGLLFILGAVKTQTYFKKQP
jgi:uncharacterized membrane protein